MNRVRTLNETNTTPWSNRGVGLVTLRPTASNVSFVTNRIMMFRPLVLNEMPSETHSTSLNAPSFGYLPSLLGV